jgi:hypothetical protein
MNWQTFFQDVPDFRINRRKRHELLDILVIALCAVVCGADDFEEIGAYGKLTRPKKSLHLLLINPDSNLHIFFNPKYCLLLLNPSLWSGA